MNTLIKKINVFGLLIIVSIFSLIFPFESLAQGTPPASVVPQKLILDAGDSKILDISERLGPLGKIELIDPKIADILVLNPRQLYLTAKSPGKTAIVLRAKSGYAFTLFELDVSAPISRIKEMGEPVPKIQADDIRQFKDTLQKVVPEETDMGIYYTPERVTLSGTVSSKANKDQVLALAETFFPKKVINLLGVRNASIQLKEALYKLMPEEKDLRITATQENVMLSGTVSSAANLSQVLAIVESYYPKKVVNLLEVSGVHQVMLEVRVAEMSRSLLKRIGFNFAYVSGSGSNFGVSVLNSLTSFAGISGISTAGPAINAIFRFTGQGGSTWTTFIDALKEEGLAKVMAEPTLIALSGKTANFLAGGEFPVPVPQPGGVGTGIAITIEYKAFGVGLNFTPTVLSNKRINMVVAPEVSQLDFTNAVQLGGFVVPGLTTRRVSTSIEMADGQSFAIAGLLQENVREVVQKFPILGDIPILGALFRSSNFQKNETELIIIVTPHLVKPLDMAKQSLPTDQYIEPDDFEFYLLGLLEGKDRAEKASGLLPTRTRKRMLNSRENSAMQFLNKEEPVNKKRYLGNRGDHDIFFLVVRMCGADPGGNGLWDLLQVAEIQPNIRCRG